VRLWLYLTLLVNALVVVAFSGFGAYMAHLRVSSLEAEIRGDTDRLSLAIAQLMGDLLIEKAFDQVDYALQRQVGLGNVTGMTVSGVDGRVISDVRLVAPGEVKNVYEIQQFVPQPSQRSWFVDDALKVVVPIRVETGTSATDLGWLLTTIDLKGLHVARSDIWRSTLWATLATLALVTLVLSVLMGRLGRSMGRVSQFAEGLSQQYGAQLVLQSPISELTAIGQALNSTSKALHAQIAALKDSEELKAAISEASLDSLIIIDSDGRVVEYNPAAVATFGWSQEEALGADLGGLILPERYRAAHQKGMEHYLRTGAGPVLRQRIELSAMHRSGREFPIELAVVPFRIGGAEFFLGSLRDISDRVEIAAERDRVNAMLQRAVDDAAVRQFALDQHAIVSITDSLGTIVYANEKLEKISQYSVDELIGQNHRLLKSGEHDASFFEQMWATISAGDVWHGEICNRSKDGGLYWVSSSIVPIKDSTGMPYQYIAVRTDISEIKRIERQLDMSAQSLGKLVDRYRLAQEEVSAAQARELALGHQIQQSMLFGELPARFGHVSLAAFTEPSKGIDGDFFDFLAYGADQFDVSIGDVMGKGVAAALIGAAVKQSVHQVIASQTTAAMVAHTDTPTPASIINGVHAMVASQLMDLESFVTLAYLRVDVARNEVHYVDAGHTQFLHVRAGQAEVVSGVNLPLGVLANEVYESHRFEIAAGDLLFLYSDGFTEARNAAGEEFGLQALSDLVTDLHEAQVPLVTMVQAIRARVHAFEGSTIPSDDRTCILMRVEDPPARGQGPDMHEYNLPWTMESLSLLRIYVEDLALNLGMSDDARDALILAVYEAATNLIRHAEPPGIQPSVCVKVADNGPDVEVSFYYLGAPFVDMQREPDFSGGSEGGFGLYIIRNSVDEVRYDSPVEGVARVYLRKSKLAAPPADGAHGW
jgi:sigma-B regulation protein RsbU (phosphoserine phosphatase)